MASIHWTPWHRREFLKPFEEGRLARGPLFDDHLALHEGMYVAAIGVRAGSVEGSRDRRIRIHPRDVGGCSRGGIEVDVVSHRSELECHGVSHGGVQC